MPFKKGNIPWNKGRKGVQKHSEETRRKMSEGHKGQIPWNRGLTKKTDKRVLMQSLKVTGRPSPLTGRKHSEERRRKNSESHKGQIPWNKGIPRRQETKDKISKKKIGVKHGPLSEEHKRKLSLALKGKTSWSKGKKRPPFSDEWKKNMSKVRKGLYVGKENPNWRGGTSFEPYSSDFNKNLKRKIGKRDNFICQKCGVKSKLVHHIDYDKTNCRENNLIILCRYCNSKANFNRVFWENFFVDLMWFFYPNKHLFISSCLYIKEEDN